MKRIDEYINKLFEHTNLNDKEIIETKAEIKSHLYESYRHLVHNENVPDEDAQQIVIERFKEEDFLQALLKETNKKQKLAFRKGFLISLLCLFIGISLYFTFHKISVDMVTQQSDVTGSIITLLQNKEEIDSNLEDEIIYTLQKSVIKNMDIYKLEDSNNLLNKPNEPSFVYERDYYFAEPIYRSFHEGGVRRDGWAIETKYSHFYELASFCLVFGVLSYWITFTIWATLKAYYLRKSPFVWGIVFLLTNILGYIYFDISRRRD
ncbi:hypothetical protein [Bacillus sp. CHD6a]|uniref:hypothetical protein n=1 Tax=Bacillus sp. CHD6a TaxID=1643452 RepID=UPI0006CD3BC5|nr:hypothetical protein [Bacillus sp. CHD6a]KPB06241.1 hypothetical protein AAV98_00020 [Bacillus sp. CHD6a]